MSRTRLSGPSRDSRIIEAMFRLLAGHGYAGASTREIAKREGVEARALCGILATMIPGRAQRIQARRLLACRPGSDRAVAARHVEALRMKSAADSS